MQIKKKSNPLKTNRLLIAGIRPDFNDSRIIILKTEITPHKLSIEIEFLTRKTKELPIDRFRNYIFNVLKNFHKKSLEDLLK